MENRIKELREERQLTQTQLGELIGVGWQSVSRWENGGNIDTDRISQLASVFDVKPIEIFKKSPVGEAVRIVSVRGFVQAGQWAENFEWPPDRWYDAPIPYDPTFRGVRLHGAETRGPSMDRVYPEGTVLIFTEFAQEGRLEIGKRYIVARDRGGERETTVKTLWRDDTGSFWLLPESSDPRFQEPIPLDPGESDYTVEIVGRVVGSWRRE